VRARIHPGSRRAPNGGPALARPHPCVRSTEARTDMRAQLAAAQGRTAVHGRIRAGGGDHLPLNVCPVENGQTTAEEGLRALATPPNWLAALADPAHVAAVLGRRVPELARGDLTVPSRQVNQAWIKKRALS